MDIEKRQELLRVALESTPSIDEIEKNLNHSLKKIGVQIPFANLIGRKMALKVMCVDDGTPRDLDEEEIKEDDTHYVVVGEIVNLTCYCSTGELSDDSELELGVMIEDKVWQIAFLRNHPGYCRNYYEETFPNCAQYKIL